MKIIPNDIIKCNGFIWYIITISIMDGKTLLASRVNEDNIIKVETLDPDNIEYEIVPHNSISGELLNQLTLHDYTLQASYF